MPSDGSDLFLVETFVETDQIRIINNELNYQPRSGWIELTVGVTEHQQQYHAFNPSITVAEGHVLSLEKFQGGTGVNLTPPPSSIIDEQDIRSIKQAIERIAKALKISNYARLDIFFNVHSKIVYLIEANTLPGLTPATVLYHQALAEPEPIYPKELLEQIINTKQL